MFSLCVFLSLSRHPGVAAESGKAGIDASSLYLHYCSQCHGIGGRGDGINSTPDMAINPRDHTEASFMSTRSDEQFIEIITGGGTRLAKSPLMPSWGSTLSGEEISALVAYLRELCKCRYEGILSHSKLRRVDPDFR
ncbi:MAG: cytochrome c [Deltaproteobacteria bacterium]|nr:cytochrome c [Deltaproteobacteria bacterium]